MAISQDKIERTYLDKMGYDTATHRLYPYQSLLNDVGAELNIEAGNNNLGDIERNNISDTIYDYMFSHMVSRNQEIVLAEIAENAQDEQITMARAFQAMAHFVLRGGDETSMKAGINFETGIYISPEVMDNISLGLQVQRILKNGNGKNNSGVWKQSTLCYQVSDVTDLVFGIDY